MMIERNNSDGNTREPQNAANKRGQRTYQCLTRYRSKNSQDRLSTVYVCHTAILPFGAVER